MTREEFIVGYCERSKVTYEWLVENGRFAKECDCGDETCAGWQMSGVNDPPHPSDAAKPSGV